MNERDRAILIEYRRRQLAKLGGFAHSYVPHVPTPKQRAFVHDESLEALYGGAAGGGKSDALLMAALKYVHVPGYAAILFRRTFSDLAKPGALMDRSRAWLLNTDARWNERDHVWRFPSGASLSFGFIDNDADKLNYQSAEYQFVGFDELTQFTSSQYTYLFSRLRKAGVNVPLRMRGATNPGGPGHLWVKRRYKLPDDVDMGTFYESEKGARFYPASLDDNPYIDRASYDLALDELEAIDQQQLRKGRWVQDAGLLVYAYDPNRDLVERLPVLPNGWKWRRVLGIDYGNVKATALVSMAFCLEYSNTVYIEASQKWTDLDPDDGAEVVQEWSKNYGYYERIVGDSGGLGKGYIVQANNRFALPIEPADKTDKLGSIKLINGATQKGRVKIVEPACEELITELEELLWKDEKKLEEKPGLENHACDARLYGWKETTAWMHKTKDRGPPKDSPEYHEQMDREAEQREIESAREEDETW